MHCRYCHICMSENKPPKKAPTENLLTPLSRTYSNTFFSYRPYTEKYICYFLWCNFTTSLIGCIVKNSTISLSTRFKPIITKCTDIYNCLFTSYHLTKHKTNCRCCSKSMSCKTTCQNQSGSFRYRT